VPPYDALILSIAVAALCASGPGELAVGTPGGACRSDGVTTRGV